jgi:hypothetical protein
MAKSNALRAKLVDTMKVMLGERATVKLLNEIDPGLIASIRAGTPVPTLAELLVDKVIKLALDPKRANQWAVELIFDRVEGKSVKGQAIREDGRQIEERLDEITTEHLNSLAAQFAKNEPGELVERRNIEDRTPGPASKLLDLHKDRAAGSQDIRGELVVAAGASEEG